MCARVCVRRATEHKGSARLCVRSQADLSPDHCKPVGRLQSLFSAVTLGKVKFSAPEDDSNTITEGSVLSTRSSLSTVWALTDRMEEAKPNFGAGSPTEHDHAVILMHDFARGLSVSNQMNELPFTFPHEKC